MKQINSDRYMIAKLAVRFAGLRAGLPEKQVRNIDVTKLSARQVELIEECLLSQLTLMNKQGWSWYSPPSLKTTEQSA